VLLTSGYTKNTMLKKAKEDEKLNFIPKPFAASVLAQKVRNILNDKIGARHDA